MYQSSKELLVLIDSDKIEKMAEDEEYRAKYEGILNNAASRLNQMKDSLGSKADSVSSFGMTFDDHGNASFLRLWTNLLHPRESVSRTKRSCGKREKESAEGSTGKTCGGEKADRTDKKGKTDGTGKAKDTEKTSDADKVTVSASSWEELLKKIE